MKCFARLVVFAVVLLVSNAHGEQMRELLHANYRSGKSLSHLTLTFDSTSRFLHTKLNAQEVRLSFPRTKSTKYENGIPLVFRNGNARSAAFDFSRRDTLTMIVALRKNVGYDLRKTPTQIVMEMYPIDTVQAVLPALDIRSLARGQMNEKPDTKTAAAEESGFEVRLIPFVASLLFSLLTTGVLMLFVMKSSPQQKARTVQRFGKKVGESASVDAVLAQARLIIKEKASVAKTATAIDAAMLERDSDALSLARRFRRGQGELELTKTFESKSRQYAWEKKVQRLDPNKSGREYVTAARQLGVGRGEINLAMALRRMQEASGRKEILT